MPDFGELDVVRFILYLFILVFSCVFHECAHVWVALKQGDTTGRDLGRLTLNPIPHIDVFWTLLLPALTYPSLIGGPKPAPVNPANFRNPRVGDLWCSLAGPASNLLLAAGALLLLRGLAAVLPDLAPPDSWNALFLFSIFRINMVLAIVNLIPVPPLDGSRFLHFIAGRSLDPVMNFFDRAGWLTAIPILFAFLLLAPTVLGFFWRTVNPGLAVFLGEEYFYTLYRTFFAR